MRIILVILMLTIPTYNNESHIVDNSWVEFPVKKESLSIDDSIRLVLSNKNLSKLTIELLVAQSKHESANYRNNLAKKHNNIFARHYHKADTFALGAGGQAEGHSRFARYKSIEYATLSQYYYLKRKNYSFEWNTPKEFAIELKKKKYYEDDIYNYTNALTKHLQNGIIQLD
jgi:hypothetical protein